MKVIGLDGKTHSWKLENRAKINCSSGHQDARELIKSIFPMEVILEEVSLPGCNGMRADFYLPKRKLLIEVQGEQHYDYTPHFHGHVSGFWQSKKRDSAKKEWCQLNSIDFVELDTRNKDEWESRILARGH